jgi:hypothetical protein
MAKKQQANQGTELTEAQKKERQEARAAAFKRLAIKRVNKAIKSLELVGNLASYKPTLEQAKVIENALVSAHNGTVERLKGTAKTVGTFTL